MAKEKKKITGLAMAMIPAETELGPAMKSLPNDKWRAFVMAMVNMGVGVNHAKCARMAGFDDGGGSDGWSKVHGHRLAHDPRVQAAIQEIGRSRLRALTLDATATLGEALLAEKDGIPDWKARLTAANSILDRGGLHALSEHHVTVTTNKSREEKLLEVAKLAQMLGKDPKELLGNLVDGLPDDMKVIEGEATEVENGK